MTFDINQIYKNLLGRDVGQEGRDYWTGQYNQALADNKTSAQAISGIKSAIAQSPEYDTPWAKHTRAAMESIGKGEGVNAGTVASYSDMYNADGTPNPNWTGEKDWLQQKVYDQHDQLQQLQQNTGGMSNDQYNTLLGNFTGLTDTLNSLKDAYAQSQKDIQAMFANANWGGGGYGGYGQTVGGVKTHNELPGWTPKTGGSSGFFGRGGSRFGLTTSSLNI